MSPPRYPFSAIVGQEEMKHALLLAAIDPGIGGVMVFGDRGTGKSTAVRALPAVLPPIRVMADCPYGCDPDANGARCDGCRDRPRSRSRLGPVPLVDLPLGATEDRVLGSLDLERALTAGQKAFEPGLLAAAHRGFLYVDEINLLEDHLVDLLLDVAASGENLVEREGLSVRHPARFTLVGSGNPEEGELRPQLLDRFGLAVLVTTPSGISERLEVVRRRDDFDRDPVGFAERWRAADQRLRRRIAAARKRLASVLVPDRVMTTASELCLRLGTDGLRAELVLMKAMRAAASLAGRREATVTDLRALAPMVLRHRLRKAPLEESGSTARIERALADVLTA